MRVRQGKGQNHLTTLQRSSAYRDRGKGMSSGGKSSAIEEAEYLFPGKAGDEAAMATGAGAGGGGAAADKVAVETKRDGVEGEESSDGAQVCRGFKIGYIPESSARLCVGEVYGSNSGIRRRRGRRMPNIKSHQKIQRASLFLFRNKT